ncbi:hypothetical protein OG594_45365 [Streptomyces sp. NBC_01214]|uniref:hypothetical protein n=1 Tax=Streptomyces sp. NBC_01214 TaxID=2903777 RepID=UPI00224C8826|nr:hypothetical protein [Streptomyces sp. NBC_01214]MCX4808715.1 hypothetical protein [Streptomyces sp. NBC_01214]
MKDPFSSSEASTLLAPVGVVDRNAARRAAADRAIDRADLAQLLDVLSLWPRDDPPAPGTTGTSPDSERGKDRPD